MAKTISKAQRKLKSAISALERKKGGRIARRTARAAVFGALKSLEYAIDAEYPLEPKAKPPETMKQLGERLTVTGMYRKLKDLAPERWDPIEAQTFANWCLDKRGGVARPIALCADTKGVDALEPDLCVAIIASEDRERRWADLWKRIAWDTRALNGSVPLRATRQSRRWVRAMAEVYEAWLSPEWREFVPRDEPTQGGGNTVLRLVGTG